MLRFTAVLLGLIVSACSSTAAPVTAQDPPPRESLREVTRTLQVSAEASVMRSPDRATIHLAVETTAGTAQEATRGNARAMTRVADALEGLGIPSSSIRTESIALSPRYQRQNVEEPTIVGYHAANRISVRVDDVDRVGPVVDAAIDAGANRVTGLQFQIADPEAAYHEALEEAVAKARREAEVLARAMDETLGPAIRVSTAGAGAPTTRGATPELMMRADAASTPVQAGELEVHASVQITYRLGS
ncbi:MAG: SIMPL domain-containing protein [Longimicrobiales bacterium]